MGLLDIFKKKPEPAPTAQPSSSTFGLPAPKPTVLTKAATQPSVTGVSSRDTAQPSTSFGQKVSDFFFSSPLKEQIEEQGGRLIEGTLPIGPGGAAKFIKPSFKNIIGKSGSVSKANLAKTFPGVSKSTINSVAARFNKLEADEVIKLLSKKPIPTSKIFKGAAAVGAGLLSTDTLTTWFALDNVLGGTKFMIPDIRKAINLGVMTREEAIEQINKADQSIELARAKVNITSRYNPLMYPARKLILAGADTQQQAWENARDVFLAESEQPGFVPDPNFYKDDSFTRGGGSGFIDPSRLPPTGDVNSPEVQDIVARRDAGEELTPEEITLLQALGLPTTRPQQQPSLGQSALGFGLV